ncbi:conserved hypothetical protein [Ricinus communis]|uniref:Uncharacterized protein n=1 Tax=Ricinus communis TaxID=3988 RepID=B9RLA5_RICCO|nr:conserved hypothetical protein [Ricinus communis]
MAGPSRISLPHSPRSFFSNRQQLSFNITYNIQNGQQQLITSTSLHAILAFVVPVLLDFIEIKCQGSSKSPFETHPVTTQFAIASLLAYSIAYGIELAFPSRLSQAIMMIIGSCSLASLASLLLPDAARPVPYVLYTSLLVGELYGVATKLCRWIHPRLVLNTTSSFWAPNMRRTTSLLPLTVVYGSTDA